MKTLGYRIHIYVIYLTFIGISKYTSLSIYRVIDGKIAPLELVRDTVVLCKAVQVQGTKRLYEAPTDYTKPPKDFTKPPKEYRNL